MSDREKVIEGLKELCEYLFHEYKVCYHVDVEDTYNRFLVANNALNLLKEQEAIKPKLVGVNTWTCGECGTLLGWEDLSQSGLELISYKYCPGCGRKVKWDD